MIYEIHHGKRIARALWPSLEYTRPRTRGDSHLKRQADRHTVRRFRRDSGRISRCREARASRGRCGRNCKGNRSKPVRTNSPTQKSPLKFGQSGRPAIGEGGGGHERAGRRAVISVWSPRGDSPHDCLRHLAFVLRCQNPHGIWRGSRQTKVSIQLRTDSGLAGTDQDGRTQRGGQSVTGRDFPIPPTSHFWKQP